MNKTLLALYGLKYNPFAPAVPASALHVGPRIDQFRRRVTHLAAEGGFALVTGEPATGKSATLRILADHLAGQRDVKVCMISRPQANIADFYRRDGRPVRRRTAAAQPMGRNPDPPSAWQSTARSPGRSSSSTKPRKSNLRFSPSYACWRRHDWIPTSC
jgi:hypothetical protein